MQKKKAKGKTLVSEEESLDTDEIIGNNWSKHSLATYPKTPNDRKVNLNIFKGIKSLKIHADWFLFHLLYEFQKPESL